MKMVQINWIQFTTILASRIIKDAVLPLDSKERVNVLVIDDSIFERNRSKKVELLAKVLSCKAPISFWCQNAYIRLVRWKHISSNLTVYKVKLITG